MQSLLDAWRAELARQPLSMSEGEACGVLGITPQPDGSVPEEELKAAYRRCGWLDFVCCNICGELCSPMAACPRKS